MNDDRAGATWDARPVGSLRLSPILRWIVLIAVGALVAVGALTVLMIATYPGSGADRDRRNGPALAPASAGAATDDPGATLQHLGAAWRAGEARRYRVRVVVAPDAP